ncbi:MAG: hypothetical protein L0Z62_19275 [Gemmataceae bacterium]|nr:hypothetical protein [Gemmataceae bacterium]
MDNKLWLVFAISAGLCWGTYVPFIQQGIRGLGNPYGSFLCVGVAYVLIAVLFPLGMFLAGHEPNWNLSGISFATLAGVAGAMGALFVIFANGSVPRGSDYRLYIAPVIFALAPVINTVVSLVWHPDPVRGIFRFGLEHTPHWTLYVGILLTGAGAALVLYSKEATEAAARTARTPPASRVASGEKP